MDQMNYISALQFVNLTYGTMLSLVVYVRWWTWFIYAEFMPSIHPVKTISFTFFLVLRF